MITHNQPQEILRFALNDSTATCLGGTDGGKAAISNSYHKRHIVIQSEAMNLSFSKSKFE